MGLTTWVSWGPDIPGCPGPCYTRVSWGPVIPGCPGPLLYFWLVTTLFSILFADDTTCLGKGKNLRELILYVNTELQKISNWFRANKMAVNAAKTKYIVFRTRGKIINPLDCNLVLNNNEIGVQNDPELIYPIERIYNDGETKNFKLLCVLFDEYLSFDEHITHLCNKISKSLFCINCIKNFIDMNTKKLLYFAMIHSHIMYCLTIYSCANATNMNRLKINRKRPSELFVTLDLEIILALYSLSLKYYPSNSQHSFTHNILQFHSKACGQPIELVSLKENYAMQTIFLFQLIILQH